MIILRGDPPLYIIDICFTFQHVVLPSNIIFETTISFDLLKETQIIFSINNIIE